MYKSEQHSHSPFTVEHFLEASFSDPGIVTLKPLVLLLSDIAGVVSIVQGATVVHHRKQRVPGEGRGYSHSNSRVV